MDELKELERLDGRGPIHDEAGNKIADGHYFLCVFQEMLDPGTKDPHRALIPGLKSIEGWIDDVDVHPLVGKALVLTLEDGRSLKFFFSDSNGNIANRGEFA